MEVPIKGAELPQSEGIPAGVHIATIIRESSHFKDTEIGDKEWVSLQFEVSEGRHEGRKMFQNFWTTHPNEMAQKIGVARLAIIAKITGLDGDTLETEHLVGKRMKITVVQQKNSSYMTISKFEAIKGRGASTEQSNMEDIPW